MPIRQALAEYLDAIRAFSFEVVKVDSGAYDGVISPSEILQQPDVWIQKEADWIDPLLEALNIIQKYIDLVRRWAIHVFGITHNLQVTHDDITKVKQKKTSIAALIQPKTFDYDYLQWIMADISQELDRLVVATRELLRMIPHFLELVEQLRGSFVENMKQIASAWANQNLDALYGQLIKALEEAHSSDNPELILKCIGSYCDIIFSVVFSTPMLVEESSIVVFSSETMKISQNRVNQIADGIQNLQEFVRLRKTAYLRFLQHIEVLLRAALPSNVSIAKWVENYIVTPTKSASELLPQQISTDILELALTQAEDARADWETLSGLLIPLRNGAHELNALLQSPVLADFLTVDRRRRDLTNKLRPMLESKFNAIHEAMQR
jgi:hypothetical protein